MWRLSSHLQNNINFFLTNFVILKFFYELLLIILFLRWLWGFYHFFRITYFVFVFSNKIRNFALLLRVLWGLDRLILFICFFAVYPFFILRWVIYLSLRFNFRFFMLTILLIRFLSYFSKALRVHIHS